MKINKNSKHTCVFKWCLWVSKGKSYFEWLLFQANISTLADVRGWVCLLHVWPQNQRETVVECLKRLKSYMLISWSQRQMHCANHAFILGHMMLFFYIWCFPCLPGKHNTLTNNLHKLRCNKTTEIKCHLLLIKTKRVL